MRLASSVEPPTAWLNRRSKHILDALGFSPDEATPRRSTICLAVREVGGPTPVRLAALGWLRCRRKRVRWGHDFTCPDVGPLAAVGLLPTQIRRCKILDFCNGTSLPRGPLCQAAPSNLPKFHVKQFGTIGKAEISENLGRKPRRAAMHFGARLQSPCA